jgi:hypothetical protein
MSNIKLVELEKMAQQTAAFGVHPSGEYIYSFYTEQLQAFAKLVAEDERKFCIQFLMELHGSQLGRNNYYHYAAQALSELNGRELPNKFSLNIRNNK